MSTPGSKLLQFAFAVALPCLISGSSVIVAMQGFVLFRTPNATERAWSSAGLLCGVLGYAALGLACVVLRKRWPVFCLTAA